MCGAELGAPVEAEVRERRDTEDSRQVVIGAILPAARPDELIALGKAVELGAGRHRDAVEHPVDQVEIPRSLRRVDTVRLVGPLESEQADHPVDVDGEDRLVVSSEKGHGPEDYGH